MKQKLIITAIVALAIGFVGVAGGFTKTVAVEKGTRWVCRNADGVRVVNPDDLLELDMRYLGVGAPWGDDSEDTVEDGWCGEWMRQQYEYTLNKEPYERDCDIIGSTDKEAVLIDKCEYKTVFDPRNTAMFVIGGAIIGLLPLARKGK